MIGSKRVQKTEAQEKCDLFRKATLQTDPKKYAKFGCDLLDFLEELKDFEKYRPTEEEQGGDEEQVPSILVEEQAKEHYKDW